MQKRSSVWDDEEDDEVTWESTQDFEKRIAHHRVGERTIADRKSQETYGEKVDRDKRWIRWQEGERPDPRTAQDMAFETPVTPSTAATPATPFNVNDTPATLSQLEAVYAAEEAQFVGDLTQREAATVPLTAEDDTIWMTVPDDSDLDSDHDSDGSIWEGPAPKSKRKLDEIIQEKAMAEFNNEERIKAHRAMDANRGNIWKRKVFDDAGLPTYDTFIPGTTVRESQLPKNSQLRQLSPEKLDAMFNFKEMHSTPNYIARAYDPNSAAAMSHSQFEQARRDKVERDLNLLKDAMETYAEPKKWKPHVVSVPKPPENKIVLANQYIRDALVARKETIKVAAKRVAATDLEPLIKAVYAGNQGKDAEEERRQAYAEYVSRRDDPNISAENKVRLAQMYFSSATKQSKTTVIDAKEKEFRAKLEVLKMMLVMLANPEHLSEFTDVNHDLRDRSAQFLGQYNQLREEIQRLKEGAELLIPPSLDELAAVGNAILGEVMRDSLRRRWERGYMQEPPTLGNRVTLIMGHIMNHDWLPGQRLHCQYFLDRLNYVYRAHATRKYSLAKEMERNPEANDYYTGYNWDKERDYYDLAQLFVNLDNKVHKYTGLNLDNQKGLQRTVAMAVDDDFQSASLDAVKSRFQTTISSMAVAEQAILKSVVAKADLAALLEAPSAAPIAPVLLFGKALDPKLVQGERVLQGRTNVERAEVALSLSQMVVIPSKENKTYYSVD